MLHVKFYHADSGSTSDGKKVTYPANMDKLMIPLCNAINKIPGLQTAWCCQGHRFSKAATFACMNQVYVSVYSDDIKALNMLSRIIASYNETHDRRWIMQMGAYSPEQCDTTRIRVFVDLNPKELTAKERTYAIRELTKTINTWRKNHE